MNARVWRLILEGRNSGARNMAVDGAIFQAVEKGESPPTVRIYGWEPFCVTLGYFQDPAVELDLEAMAERGWDFVLRPTGGRAVLHAEEITYSLSAAKDAAPWCATLALSHARIGEAWAEALRDFSPRLASGAALEDARKGTGPGLPCFASTARSELTHAGRKIIGSAQRRTRNAFLQHGSIPLTPRHESLVEVLKLDPERRRAYLKVLRQHAVSLGEIGPIPSDREPWIQRLARTFCSSLGIAVEAKGLSAAEEAAALELEKIRRIPALSVSHA